MTDCYQERKQRIMGLDLARAIAISFVLLSHVRYLITPHFPVFEYLQVCGFLGVELFFVLSGFLITGILIRDRQEMLTKEYLGAFWVRRWRRTLPAYYLFLLLNVIFFSLFTYGQQHWVKYLFFLQNFNTPMPEYFSESWSLSVEEWFYLLVPLSLWLLLKCRLSFFKGLLLLAFAFIVLPTLARLSLSSQLNINWDRAVRNVVVYQLDAIMFGVLAAIVKWKSLELWQRYSKLVFLFGIILLSVVACVFYTVNLNQSVFARTLLFSMTSFGCALLMPAFDQWRVEKRRWIHNVIHKVALWSYSLYLCNTLVLLILMYAFEWRIHMDIYFLPISLSIYFGVSFTIAAITYHYYERRWMGDRKRRKESSLVFAS